MKALKKLKQTLVWFDTISTKSLTTSGIKLQREPLHTLVVTLRYILLRRTLRMKSYRTGPHAPHGQNHTSDLKSRGFTLIEVIIALTVTGLGLTPLFVSQGRLITQTGRSFAAFEGMIELKNFMYTTAQKTAEKQKKITEEKNGVTFSYEVFAPTGNSSLKNIKNIELIKAQAEWDFFAPDGVMFPSAVAVPPKPTESETSKEKQTGTQK